MYLRLESEHPLLTSDRVGKGIHDSPQNRTLWNRIRSKMTKETWDVPKLKILTESNLILTPRRAALCVGTPTNLIFPRTAVLFLVKVRTTLAYDCLKLLDFTVTQNQDHSCLKLDRIRFSKGQCWQNWAVYSWHEIYPNMYFTKEAYCLFLFFFHHSSKQFDRVVKNNEKIWGEQFKRQKFS